MWIHTEHHPTHLYHLLKLRSRPVSPRHSLTSELLLSPILSPNIHTPVRRFIEQDRFPHLLMYGPPGTGKTSTIKACAQMMYGAKIRSMVLEVSGQSEGTVLSAALVPHDRVATRGWRSVRALFCFVMSS